MAEQSTYEVPGMQCGHCRAAVERELSAVDGVESVEADVATKVVAIRGRHVDDAAVRVAIEAAGYEAA